MFDVKYRFINQRYQIQNILFNFFKISKAYSGVKFTKLLFEIFKIYRCIDYIRFLVFDNASILDIMINNLEKRLTDADVDWPAIFHRI